MLLSMTTSPIFIILDALDEYTGSNDREELLDIIAEIMNESKSLHILVTSRKERDIETKLGDLFDDRIALEESVVNGDIALYIRRKLENDDALREWDTQTKDDIEQALRERAQGMSDPINALF
jgi:primase-polymerase (primpol)-like protein